jgi:hypothetical protein
VFNKSFHFAQEEHRRIESFCSSNLTLSDALMTPKDLFNRIGVSCATKDEENILLMFAVNRGTIGCDPSTNLIKLNRNYSLSISKGGSISQVDKDIFSLKTTKNLVDEQIKELGARIIR